MADEFGERTEEATPKRRAEARDSGNVAQSQDLSAALLLLGVTITLWYAMTPLLGGLRQLVQALLEDDFVSGPLDPGSVRATLMYAGWLTLRYAGPIILVAWIVAALSHVVQIGWIFAPQAVAPSLNKLNPTRGLKRIFSINGVVKTGMDCIKVLLVLTVAVITVSGGIRDIIYLPVLSVVQAAGVVGHMLFVLALRLGLVLLVLGLADFTYQKWRFRRDMRMSKQQIKDEMKQSEGDPDVKRRRIRMQQQIAMQRINAAVPRADVVVTNPEHVAIAIQYDASKMNAPRVVAKGADYLAMRIRQLAMRHGIPIIERPPLARLLYQHVDVNREIPPQFYQAVAEILAYVYRLGGRKAG